MKTIYKVTMRQGRAGDLPLLYTADQLADALNLGILVQSCELVGQLADDSRDVSAADSEKAP